MAARLVLSRRQLLVAGGAGLLVAACGGGSDGGTGDDARGDEGTPAPERGGTFTLYRVFPAAQPVAQPVRLPLALADAEGSLDLDDPPGSVEVTLVDPAGRRSSTATIRRRADGIPRGYYPAVVELSSPGRWTLEVDAGDDRLATTVDARNPGELPDVPAAGDQLPRIPTPTVTDARGVDPICTREPACPFHDVPLDQAIASGRPILYLVSTPAYCQTAICGPVLDLVIDRRDRLARAGVTVVHAEVYTDDTAKVTTPAVDTLGLTYEPALFLAGPGGTVRDRLDYTFDATELDEALRRLGA
jgi:hypothetical protein